MDLNKINVLTLNNYIELTHDVEVKYKDVKIVLDTSLVLCLKKICSLEIEYFKKHNHSGAAFKLFERLLSSPPSKIWGLLGSDIIGLIQYWLDAVRKHLIGHHIQWWDFLKQLLEFIKELKLKDASLSNKLVEEIAESLLDLATNGKPNVIQRYEILHTFNLLCADSSKKIRLALKSQFEHYFIRLSTIIATCGHLPSQFAAVEALLRWLQPRQDPKIRKEAAKKWFLPHLYPKSAVDTFLSRSWMDFIMDARDFLKCVNETNELVTSVVCKKLCVGDMVVISGDEGRPTWLDVNLGSECVTVMLEPRLLAALGAARVAACETLVVHRDAVTLVKLYMESSEMTLSVAMSEGPVVAPSGARLFGARCDVTAALSSRTDARTLHRALAAVFSHHYQLLMDLDSVRCLSPIHLEKPQRKNNAEENSRFSHPAKEKRGRLRPVQCATWSRRFTLQKSPSTTSTASLAKLNDKLVKLPYYSYDKEHAGCAAPNLSVVNETNESVKSLDSDGKFKLIQCAHSIYSEYRANRTSQSDTEIIKNTSKDKKSHDENIESNVNPKGSQSDKYVKKAEVDGININSLFINGSDGSAENSMFCETIAYLSKDKDADQLIDLLLQDALQAKAKDNNIEPSRQSDSGINIEEAKTQEQTKQDTETIEDTQYTGPLNSKPKTARLRNIKAKNPNNKIVSKSTSDESNTEAINETPVSFVNFRKRNQRRKSVRKSDSEITDDNATFAIKDVEEFFSQHFAENKRGDIIISPTLAKKINETSTESSEDYLLKNIDEGLDICNENVQDCDIIECLNDIVDRVCHDFEKCTEYLDQPGTEIEILGMAKNLKSPILIADVASEDIGTATENSKKKEIKKPSKNAKAKGKQTIKLKFPSKKQKPKPKAKSKLQLEPVPKMSTIPEDNNESEANKSSGPDQKDDCLRNEKTTLLARRKRKLYSPKDDQMKFYKYSNEVLNSQPETELPAASDNEDNVALAELKKDILVTPKSTTSCYKEIEKERKKYKKIRSRKSKNIESPQSPKTKKLDDAFEHLKDNIEVHENERIILVDKRSDKDAAIFNFTSDSEDEDFKQKKIEIQKRTSTTTIGSGTSLMSTRRGRTRSKVNYSEDRKESANETTKPKRKRAPRRKTSNISRDATNRPTDLIDEKMRKAVPEELNSSFIITNINNDDDKIDVIKEPEPMILASELEVISDDHTKNDVETIKDKEAKKEKSAKKQDDKKATKKKEEKKKVPKNVKCMKTQDDENLKLVVRDEEGTISPLPGLIIETEQGEKEVENSITTNLVKKIQNIYNGADVNNDTITTQNMLSDNEKPNSSPRMNITDELGKAFGDDSSYNGIKQNPKNIAIEDKAIISDVIDDTMNSDHLSIISTKPKSNKRTLRLRCKDKTETSINSTTKKELSLITTTKEKIENQQGLTDSQKSKTDSVKVQIEKINDEIICVESQITTRRKTAKTQSFVKEIEVIDIESDIVIKSERSIATDSIPGHGDMEEMPPSPTLLSEKLTPREIQDMDPVIREYYNELSNKVNNSKDSIESQTNKRKTKTETSTSKKVIKEADFNSEASSTIDEKESQKRFNARDYDLQNLLPSRRQSESEDSSQTSERKSPCVSITRLSSKEIAKYLPSTKITPESSFLSAEDTQETVRRSARIKNVTSKITPDLSYETTAKSQNTSRHYITNMRKSQISPIKLDDFFPKRKVLGKEILRSKDDTLESQDEIAKKYFLKPTHESSPLSREDRSERSILKMSNKRKSPPDTEVLIKKRKLDDDFRIETIDISESRQSSNVEDWLKYISSISAVDNINASSDALQNLMEKLDTTLAEIHQNTTKDFISLFVEVQGRLAELKAERRRSHREAARGILTEVTRLVDTQFTRMEEQAEEREASLMSWMKERAADVLRRDCRQKRAMVTLLREDVQAVNMHLHE